MSIINNIFNIIYICSYKNNPRLEVLKKNYDSLCLNYKIIFGPLSNDILLSKLLKENKISKKYLNSPLNNKVKKIICALNITHGMAWTEFLNSEFKNCIIVEDDAFFINNINNFLIKDKIPKDYEFIQLGWENYKFNQDGAKDEKYNNYFDKLYWGRAGAHCYSINRIAAKKLLKYLYPIYKAPDGYIGDMCFINKNYSKFDFKEPNKEDKIYKAYISKKKLAYGISNLNEIPKELNIDSNIKNIFIKNATQKLL